MMEQGRWELRVLRKDAKGAGTVHVLERKHDSAPLEVCNLHTLQAI